MAADAGKSWDARLYDDKHAFVWKHGASLVELLEPRAGERILDLGCGTGHLTAQLAQVGAEVIGIDQDGAMIDEARRNYPQLRFEVADARDFSFPEPFDGVFSNAVLHWVRPPEAAVRCIRNVLKPGGRFVAEFGGQGNVGRIVDALRRLIGRYAGAGAERLLPAWYYPSIAEYTGLLEREGLEPTNAILFPRRTLLEGAAGLRNWVTMFVREGVAAIPGERREAFFSALEDELRNELWSEGAWYADYRRLRVVAVRTT
ncbi:MAG: methyltransferase domain-containing protein [Planctomycetia bacterium]|nr:methyltransferase domain-containing protein [Planctomycetia bacterium]